MNKYSTGGFLLVWSGASFNTPSRGERLTYDTWEGPMRTAFLMSWNLPIYNFSNPLFTNWAMSTRLFCRNSS